MSELILSHERADFDALASMVVARKLHPEAVMTLVGPPEPAVKGYLALHRGIFPVGKASEIDLAQVTRIILVDTRNPARLGRFRHLVSDPKVALVIYDHHPPTREAVRGDEEHIQPLGAAVTVLLQELRRRGLRLTPDEATLGLLGIYEETGSLTNAGTTSEDLATAAWLMDQGGNLSLVPRFVGQVLTVAQRQLLTDLLQSARTFTLRGVSVAIACAERESYIQDLSLLTSRLLEMLGVEVVLSLVRMGDSIFVVGRALDDAARLDSLLAGLGGGGHGAAASASLAAQPLDPLAEQLLAELARSLPGRPTARDLMTSPVLCLEDPATVQDAVDGLRELGHTAAGIRREGKLIGWIARSDVDKALAHGLGHAPADAYMSTELVSVAPGTTLDEIQRLLVERDIGRVPVLEEGELVGIVSRTDLLRWLNQHRASPAGRTPEPVDLSHLPERLRQVLREAADTGRELGMEVYLVGGSVRDLMLDRPIEQDLDLVVEGDARRFAYALARGAHVHPHDRFQTAVVCWPDGLKVDVAAARRETYVRPAALPVVQGSTLKQDLARRDFSINAMAVRLQDNALIDFFGARRDLGDGHIRVLHNHSFIDDPTRIMRAVRFEQRLGFRLEPHTEHLLRQALAENALEMVSPERLRDELLLILTEQDPLPALQRAQKLGILRRMHPALQIHSRVERTLRRTGKVQAEFGRVDPPWLLPLLALVSCLKREQLAELREDYKLNLLPGLETRMDTVRLMRRLSKPDLKDSQLERLLKPLPREAVLWLMAMNFPDSPSGQRVDQRLRRYLVEIQPREPVVTGADLRRWGYPPGPLYREILDRVREQQLDEGIEDPRSFVEHTFPGISAAG